MAVVQLVQEAASSGASHEPQLQWQARHVLPPLASVPRTKPTGQAATHWPRWMIGKAPLGSQPVHASEPGPSQLAHVLSHASHDPIVERNSPPPQLS